MTEGGEVGGIDDILKTPGDEDLSKPKDSSRKVPIGLPDPHQKPGRQGTISARELSE